MSLEFHDNLRFPTEIEYGFSGGPRFKTTRTQANSGYIQSIINYRQALREYEISDANQTDAQRKELLKFFYQVYGGGIGFRFKDWFDYEVTALDGVFGEDGPEGDETEQLYKSYSYSSNHPAYNRIIQKPVYNTVKIYKNGTLQSWPVNYTNGKVTIPILLQKTITAITKATNAQITTATEHNFLTNDKIKFKDLNISQLNNKIFTITRIDATRFSIDYDTTNFDDLSGTANAILYETGRAGNTYSWEGEFDVPVVFAEDYGNMTFETFNKISFKPRLMEIRA